MVVTPVPVVPPLLPIQSRVFPVLLVFAPLAPIIMVGAIFIVAPPMIVTVVSIVITGGTAGGGYGRSEGESKNERSYILQYSFHIDTVLDVS
ncbi:MAG: hypothetical protein DMG30_06330 [Acidobacteria bacterium]|nr:MAG: hypothetical protein DMG30_06330 [Acidobacteriota bacterium]